MALLKSGGRTAGSAASALRALFRAGAGADGRVMLILLLALYFGIVWYGARTHNWEAAWRRVRVPAMPADFADARGILSSYDRFRAGAPMDQVQLAPLNSAHTYSMTYPRTWLAFAYLGLGESATYATALTLIAACFALSLLYLGRLSWGEAVVYAPVWISPSLMLGVERGNADLLMYLMVLAACWLFGRRAVTAACAVLLGAGMLKLYPVAAMAPALRHRRGLITVSIFAVLFLGFCFFDRQDLAWVHQNTSRDSAMSFGAFIMADRWHWPHLAGTLLAAGVALGALVSSWRAPAWALDDDVLGAGFLAGSAMLVLCFVIGNNYMYRWWFALLLMPQLMRWIRTEGPATRWAAWMLAGLVVTTWATSESRLWLAGMLLNWLLFSGLIRGLAGALLPSFRHAILAFRERS